MQSKVACILTLPQSVILKLPPSSITCRLGTVMELRTFGMDAKEERTSNILKISVDDVSSINNEVYLSSKLNNSQATEVNIAINNILDLHVSSMINAQPT